MKVLIIHTAYKLKGGEDTVVTNEMTLLNAMGIETSLLLFSNTGNTLEKVATMIYNYSSYRETIERIKAFNPDVVHVHNLHFAASPSVIYAINRQNIPFVITIHNYRMLCPSATLFAYGSIFTDSINRSFSWKAIAKGVYQQSKLLTFWVSCSMLVHKKLGTYKLPTVYIALGSHTKEIFAHSKLKYLTDKMVIKPNFCYNASAFNPSIGKYYLYVGRLSDEKGVNTLLKAFTANKLPLKIAGTGPLREEVIKVCKLAGNIQYLDAVNKETVDQLLTHAIALVFPSQWYETFGMVIIEAFAKSVPVIVSDLGQPAHTVNDNINGLHFKSADAADLIKKVSFFDDMKTDEKLEFKKNAFASYNKHYSPETNAAQLKSIYSRAIEMNTQYRNSLINIS